MPEGHLNNKTGCPNVITHFDKHSFWKLVGGVVQKQEPFVYDADIRPQAHHKG